MRDARNFLDVAETASDPQHANQAASNAILAAIAANDAICIFLGKPQPGGQSHTEAARILREACKGTRWEDEAAPKVRQLLAIISHKNAAQYTGRLLSQETADRIIQQAERFLEWAEQIVRG